MKKDVGWKSFFEDNHRYADIINGIGCNGTQFIKDTDLQEADTASNGKARDLITFVLYSGKEPWDGPVSLHDMVDFTDIPESLRKMTADYSINLIDIRRMKDTSMFQTDVRHVFNFIRCADDKKALYDLVNKEPYYQVMDNDAYDVVSLYTNSKELVGIKEYEVAGGKKNVCQAIKDLMEDSRAEGLEQGLEQGIRALVDTCKSFQATREETLEKLQEQFHISKDIAIEKLEKYW